MTRREFIWRMLAASLCLSGCEELLEVVGELSEEELSRLLPAPASEPEEETTVLSEETRELLATMTRAEKIAQLFLVRPEALCEGRDSSESLTVMTESLREGLCRYPVGGLILFAANLLEPEQTRLLTQEIREASPYRPFLAIDEEGGLVARIGRQEAFPVERILAAQIVGEQGEEAVKQSTQTIGEYLKDYGFNLDFAPVADVNTNPDNPVIGSRAYSSDPEEAAVLVASAVQGFSEAGILCTLKHFPGHGDTEEDSHEGSASTQKTLEELEVCEFLPFAAGIAAGAELVMAGHILAEQVTETSEPASLSYRLITEVLRERLGFSGVVVTDSLTMSAITDHYTAGEAAVAAVLAGVDLLLMPENLEEAYEAVCQAVSEGVISEQRLEESLRRIWTIKEKI